MKKDKELEALRAMPHEDLKKKVAECEEEIMHLHFRKASRQLTSSAALKHARRNLARVNTILKQAIA